MDNPSRFSTLYFPYLQWQRIFLGMCTLSNTLIARWKALPWMSYWYFFHSTFNADILEVSFEEFDSYFSSRLRCLTTPNSLVFYAFSSLSFKPRLNYLLTPPSKGNMYSEIRFYDTSRYFDSISPFWSFSIWNLITQESLFLSLVAFRAEYLPLIR